MLPASPSPQSREGCPPAARAPHGDLADGGAVEVVQPVDVVLHTALVRLDRRDDQQVLVRRRGGGGAGWGGREGGRVEGGLAGEALAGCAGEGPAAQPRPAALGSAQSHSRRPPQWQRGRRACRLWLLLKLELLSTIFSSSSISSACGHGQWGWRWAGGQRGAVCTRLSTAAAAPSRAAMQAALRCAAASTAPPQCPRCATGPRARACRSACMKALTATLTLSGFLHSGSAVDTTWRAGRQWEQRGAGLEGQQAGKGAGRPSAAA